MKRMLPFLLTAIMLVTLAAGCAADGAPTSTTAAGGTTATGTTTTHASPSGQDFSDRELIIGISECNNNFDSYASYGTDNYGHAQIYDCLMEIDKDGKIVPCLAESYEISSDGLIYTFKLRKGVKFTNGEELKASDVAFSAGRAIESPYTGSDWAPVDHAEVVDDYTVKLIMKIPSMSFLETLSGSFATIQSEKAYKQFGDQYGLTVEAVVGTGPYILKEWSYGEMCYYEANPDYFKGEADIKKVRFKAITDPNSAVIALETGEIDYYFNDLPAVSYDSVSKNEKLTILSYAGSGLTYAIMNTEEGIFSDVRMRQAVAYAIDLNKMLIMGAEGLGQIVHTPGGPDYNANPGDTQWYELNVEKGKELVRECGMEGSNIVIRTYSTGAYPKLATALQQDLTNIGLAAEVVQMERNAFISDVLDKGEYQIGICGFGSSTRDMDVMYPHLHSSTIGISGNWSRYVNPAMDTLLEKARGEANFETRVDLYRQAIKLYVEEAVEIPFYYINANKAFTTDIVTEFCNINVGKVYNFTWND